MVLKVCLLVFHHQFFLQDQYQSHLYQIKEEEKRKELKQAQRAIEADPNVQSLVEAFGAKVVESSIEPRTEK